MQYIKRILIGLFTFSLFCTTLLAVQYVDEDKIGMSSFISDGNITLVYNSAQSRLEANSAMSENTASIFIGIDPNYTHKIFQYISFEFSNNSDDDLELGTTYTFGTEVKLEDGETILMQQGDKYYLAYAKDGLFRVPPRFEGRIFLPYVDTKESIQQLTLITRNKKGFVDYYVSKFRLINLQDETLINDFMESKFTANSGKVQSTLDSKYELTYLSDENAEVLEDGTLSKIINKVPSKISMTIKDHEEAMITTMVDLNTIPEPEKKPEPIPVPDPVEEIEPPITGEELTEDEEALVKLNIPNVNEVKVIVNPNSYGLKTNVVIFTQLGVSILIAFFILGVVYLIYLAKQKK